MPVAVYPQAVSGTGTAYIARYLAVYTATSADTRYKSDIMGEYNKWYALFFSYTTFGATHSCLL